MYCEVDLSTNSGEVSIYGSKGYLYVANYEITYNSQGKYIKFEEKNSYSQTNVGLVQSRDDISLYGTRGRYFKEDVVRTYNINTVAPFFIFYSENGPYGYGFGTLSKFAYGTNVNNPGTFDIWYQGFLYYDEGGVLPNSYDEHLD